MPKIICYLILDLLHWIATTVFFFWHSFNKSVNPNSKLKQDIINKKKKKLNKIGDQYHVQQMA